MLRTNLWRKTVPRVELDQRSREARLRLERIERQFLPCGAYLVAYLDGAGLREDPKGPLFRTIGHGTGKLTRTVLSQANAYAMIRRRSVGRHRDQARKS
jgi:hypothetical protein